MSKEPTPFVGTVLKTYKPIDFCIISILRSYAKSIGAKICTAHPLSNTPKAQVLPYDAGFKAIDWAQMNMRNYKNEIVKNICMAECILPSPVSADNFFCIYVCNNTQKEYINKLADNVFGRHNFFASINTSFFLGSCQ